MKLTFNEKYMLQHTKVKTMWEFFFNANTTGSETHSSFFSCLLHESPLLYFGLLQQQIMPSTKRHSSFRKSCSIIKDYASFFKCMGSHWSKSMHAFGTLICTETVHLNRLTKNNIYTSNHFQQCVSSQRKTLMN